MKRAILVATPEFLREILQLPEGTIVTDIRVPFYKPGVIEIAIEGAGWECPEGFEIMRAAPAQINKEAYDENYADVTVDWGLG